MTNIPTVYVEGDAIDIDFKLADDCTFGICLTKEEALLLYTKLHVALYCAPKDVGRVEIT
jgi:hypothetical protein